MSAKDIAIIAGATLVGGPLGFGIAAPLVGGAAAVSPDIPDVPELPAPPTPEDAAASLQAQRDRGKRRFLASIAGGREGTILTGGGLEQPTVSRRTLLG